MATRNVAPGANQIRGGRRPGTGKFAGGATVPPALRQKQRRAARSPPPPRDPDEDLSPALEDPLVDQLFPVVAKAVDSYGGIIRMNVLLADPEVSAIRKQFPAKNPRYKISKILGAEPRYFTLIENAAYVATAMGYSQGYVSEEEGQITQAGIDFLNSKKEEIAEKYSEIPAKRPRVEQQPEIKFPRREPTQTTHTTPKAKAPAYVAPQPKQPSHDILMKKASGKFIKAFESGTDVEFEDCLRECRRLRKIKQHNSGGGAAAPKPQFEKRAPAVTQTVRATPKHSSTFTAKAGYEPTRKREREVARVENTEPGPVNEKQLKKDLEALMLASAKVLRRSKDMSMCMSALSTDYEVQKAKKFLTKPNGYKMPIGKLYTVCYPNLFSTETRANNQLHVTLSTDPGTVIGRNPPLEIPQQRIPNPPQVN